MIIIKYCKIVEKCFSKGFQVYRVLLRREFLLFTSLDALQLKFLSRPFVLDHSKLEKFTSLFLFQCRWRLGWRVISM